MNPTTRRTFNPLRVGFAVLIAFECMMCTGRTNGTNAHIAGQLDRVITILSGTISVRELAASLARQTGTSVIVAEYLADRTIVCSFPPTSLRSVLDSLAQLHDWAWIITDDGSVRIDLPPLKPPRSMDQLAAAIPAVLPIDIRQFIGIGSVPDTERTGPHGPVADSASSRGKLETQTSHRIYGALHTEEALFAGDLPKNLEPNQKLLYASLSDVQKKRLMLILLFNALNDTEYSLLYGAMAEYARKPLECELEFSAPSHLAIKFEQKSGGAYIRRKFGTTIHQWSSP